MAAPKSDEPIGELDGYPVYAKNGRYGPYVQWGDHDDPPPGFEKPKMSSLFKTMILERMTMDEAEALLQLPRQLGDDPTDGVAILANNGRYGPYVQKERDYRNIDSEDQLLQITLDDALKIFSQPKVYKRGGGNMAAKGPLREFGTDPVSERPVVAKDGKFGVYVTDGETNASLGKGDRLDAMGPERAFELLAIRRDTIAANGGPKKKAGQKRPAKKAAAKKKPREAGRGEEVGGQEAGPTERVSPAGSIRPRLSTSAGAGRCTARRDSVRSGTVDGQGRQRPARRGTSRSRAPRGAASRRRRRDWPSGSTPCSPGKPVAPRSGQRCERSSTTPPTATSTTGPRRSSPRPIGPSTSPRSCALRSTPADPSSRDRSAYSSLAYQGYGRQLDIDEVRTLNEWATGGRWPDIVIFLDTPDDVIAERMSRRALDRFESESGAFHERVLDGFRTMAAADPDRWITVQAIGSIDKVAEQIVAALAAHGVAVGG